MHKQQGIALFISIIFLLLLSGLTTILMTNASLDLKMAGASVARLNADQQLEGAMGELVSHSDARHRFASAVITSKFTVEHIENVTAEVVNIDEQSSCARSRAPSSVGLFSCRYVDTRLTKNYGRAKSEGGYLGTNAAGLGVEQKLLKK